MTSKTRTKLFHWRNNKVLHWPPVPGQEKANFFCFFVFVFCFFVGLQRWLGCRYGTAEHRSASALSTLYGSRERARTKRCFMDYKMAIGHVVNRLRSHHQLAINDTEVADPLVKAGQDVLDTALSSRWTVCLLEHCDTLS